MKTIQSAMLAAVLILCGAAYGYAQQSQQAAQAPVQQSSLHGPALKSETREVRVDVIVTDKKGTYVRDLKKEEFKDWEDNK